MLGQKLRNLLRKISGKPYIDEKELKSIIKELQRILISSDVNVRLVLKLSKNIEKKALEEEKREALSLKEHVLKVVYDELVGLMGESYSPRLDKHKILLVGLYGSGKTTTAGKLAYFYKKKGLSVALVGADCDRPAAKEQLRQIAKSLGVGYFTIEEEKDSAKIVEDALKSLKEDIIIVDSAGRNAFNQELAEELKRIYSVLNPEETFLVVSGDIGQIAGKQAEAFSSAVPITGVIVTKMDGSAKGGGALSAVAATGAKIAFLGMGEKPGDFEIYNPEKFVGRLLGIPDFDALMEKVKKLAEEEQLSENDLEELNLETFLKQLKAAKKMGPLDSVFSMLGAPDVPKDVLRQGEEKLRGYEALINSMTKEERKHPDVIRKEPSRMVRIAEGSGRSVKELRQFLNEFNRMEKMMKKLRNNRGLKKKLEKMLGGLKFN